MSKPAASGVLVREARGDNAETCFHYFAHVCVYIYCNIIFMYIYMVIYISIHTVFILLPTQHDLLAIVLHMFAVLHYAVGMKMMV